MESMIYSYHEIDGSIERYNSKFVGKALFQKEIVDLDEIFALVARGFLVLGWGNHVFKMMKAIYELMHALWTWYFRIDEF